MADFLAERSITLRHWEIYSADDGGVVCEGVVKGKEEEGPQTLDELIISDKLLTFLKDITWIPGKGWKTR